MTRLEQNLDAGHSTGQCRRLADVLTATRTMLECASAGDWDQVAELERARREELELCFAEPVAAQHSELVSEALAVMLHLNEELMNLLATARDTVLEQGVQQARTRTALGSYQDIQHAPG
jgi:ABC-type histidine transport system ATPase subunit